MNNIKIVAEIGCNHNGDISLAEALIRAAHEAGADAVKFQTFKSEALVSGLAPKAEYQKKDNAAESQLDMLKKLELSPEEYMHLKHYAETLGIEIFSTAFDMRSIQFLEDIGQKIWKIPSGEITNLPYLEKIRDIKCAGKEIILSTGMSTVDEIKEAVDILSGSKDTRFTVLHCNTEYPTADCDMNLRAIRVLQREFPDWNVGLSDHSGDTIAAVAAAGMGISFIEKHFTMDKNLPGPDHKASITPDELKILCTNIRRVEILLGQEKKFVTSSENKNKYIARKSIVASRDIKAGEVFTVENLTCKRPGNGISPMKWYEILGRKAEKDFSYDDLITCAGIEWEDKNE